MQATPKAMGSMQLIAGRPVMRLSRTSSRLVPRTASLEAPTGVAVVVVELPLDGAVGGLPCS